MIEFEVDEQKNKLNASIKVIGVGGAGGNTLNCIIASGYDDMSFIAVNTDAQALEHSKAPERIQIGIKSTKGLGTGTDAELGKRSAEEDLDKVMKALEGSDIVFVTAGMGGGTGSGAAPVIARLLREKGILSIAVVTRPFLFEGKRRSRVADQAIAVLAQEVDTLLVIPNQKLLDITGEQVSMIDGFAMINEVLAQSVRGITDIIVKPGHINVDFADVRTIMKDRGFAVMGTGVASGQNRAKEAAIKAISSPLLENMSIAGAQGVLMNITGGKNLGIHEISQAASVIYEQAHEDANIIIGSVIDESLSDMISITVIATGFEKFGSTQSDISDVQTKKDLFIHPTVRAEQHSISFYQQSSVIKHKQEIGDVHEKKSDKIVKQEAFVETKPEERGGATLLDINDLDVPTFLRKEKQ